MFDVRCSTFIFSFFPPAQNGSSFQLGGNYADNWSFKHIFMFPEIIYQPLDMKQCHPFHFKSSRYFLAIVNDFYSRIIENLVPRLTKRANNNRHPREHKIFFHLNIRPFLKLLFLIPTSPKLHSPPRLFRDRPS